jgi:hypothetical protein
MTLGIDHALIAVENLDEAIQQYQAIGFEAYFGGEHPNHGTHNALVPLFDGFYLELIAMKDSELASQFPHTRKIAGALSQQNRYITFALDTDEIQSEIDQLRLFGIEIHDPIAGARKRSDGVEVAWNTAHFEQDGLPFIIEDETPRETRIPPPIEGIGQHLKLVSIQLVSTNQKELSETYSLILDSDSTHSLKANRGTIEISPGERDEIQSLIFETENLSLISEAWEKLGNEFNIEEPPNGGSILIPKIVTGAAFQIIST